MSDELDIRLKTTLEADEAASVTQIKSQIPSIERGLKSSKIKVPVEADVSDITRSVQESAKAATSSLKTGGKVTIPIAAAFNFDLRNSEQVRREVQRLVGEITQNKGNLVDFKINTDGLSKAKSVFLTYKNEAAETVNTLLKLKKVGDDILPDGSKQPKFAWIIDSGSYKRNLAQLDQISDRMRKLKLDAENLKLLQGKSNVSLDWSKFDDALNSGNIKQASTELEILLKTFRNLNTAMSADMPNQAIENLPKKLQDAATSVNVLSKQFDALSTRGAAVPNNVGTELATLAQELQKISSAPITEGSLKQFGDITQRVNALKNTLKEVGVAFRLENAEKGMDALGVNIQKTQQRLLNMKVLWSAFLKDPQLVASWNKLFDSSKVVQTTGDMRVLNAEIGLLEKQIQGKGLDQKSFFGRLGDNVKKFVSWFAIGSFTAGAARGLREVVTAVKDVDQAMVQLRKVTNETDDTYKKFLDGAGKKATELATSVSSYIDAVGRFAQMGFSLPDSESLAQVASMYLNVGDGVGSMDESVASIISTIKSFKIEAQSSSQIIDVFNEVGNRFAVTSGDIGQAMQRAGSALATSNNSLEQSVALWTAMNEILQDGDVSATSLRFITQRMRNTAGQLQEMGEDADGAAESVTALQQKIKGLTGVDLMASPTEFRDTYSVLQDISKVWDDITDKDRADVIRLLAGTRQSSSFSALMQNFSTAEDALQVALDSSGSAYRENLKWLDSIEAKQKQAQAQFQAFSVAILNSDLVKFTYDAGTGILGFLTNVTESLGALPTLATAAAAALSFKNKGIFQTNAEKTGLNLLGMNMPKMDAILSAKDAGKQFDSFKIAVGEGSEAQSKFIESLKSTDAIMGDYLKTVGNGKASYEGYATFAQKAIKAQKAMTLSAKATAVAMNALKMALNMAIFAGASIAINAAVKALDNWIVTADEAKKSASDLAAEWEEADQKLSSTKSTIDSVAYEYASLSKGVGSFGKNISLTSDEYARHNTLANQIADVLPELVTGWTDEGTAILSTRGSVEELTQAYQGLIDKQNQVKANSLTETLISFNKAFDGTNFWGNGREQFQKQIVETIMEAVESGQSSQELWDSWTPEAQNAAANVYKSAGYDVGLFGGLNDYFEQAKEDTSILRAYYEEIVGDMELSVSNVRESILGILSTSDAYDELDSNAKTLISSFVSNLDSDFVSSFAQQKNGGLALRTWLNESILAPLEGFNFGTIVDAQQMFESSDISLKEYRRYYGEFVSEISKLGLDSDVLSAITSSFTSGTSTLLENVRSKLQNEFDKNADTLTLNDLEIASNLAVPTGILYTWDELLAKIQEVKQTSPEAIDSLSASIKSLTDEQTALTNALTEQGKNGYIAYETYQALIDANSAYADSFENVNGVLRLNADAAMGVADANAQLALAEAEAAQAAKKAQIDKNAAEIENVTEQLKEMQKVGMGDAYDALVAQRDELMATGDILDNDYQKYQAITSQIRAMTGAYSKYVAAQQSANSGDVYESMSGVSDTLKEALKQGKIINDDVQSAVDYILGGDSSELSYEEQLERAKEAQKKFARYFTEDNTGQGNFISDIVKSGLATQKDGYTYLNEGVTGKDVMESLGLSQDAVIAMFKDLEEYGWKFDWSALFPEMTPEEIEQAGEPASIIDQEAKQLVEDAGGYGESADEAAKIISDARQKVLDALAGKTPTEETPQTPSSGTSLFTAGQSNESPNVTPTQGGNSVVEHTVLVNVTTGEPISIATLLIGVTENSDGSFSCDVTANASAGSTIGKEALVLNVNEDGGYDVFVNGTPGTTISRDSLVLGTNATDGSYTVTINGAAGQRLSKKDLLLSLSEDETWEVTTNAKAGVQVKAPELISGVIEDDGDLSYDVSINTAVSGGGVSATEVLPGVTENADGSLSYKVSVVPQTGESGESSGGDDSSTFPQLISQDNANAEEQKHKIVAAVYFEMTPDDKETWEGLQEFSSTTLVIPADADPAEAEASIAAFEGNLETIIIDVDGDTIEAVKQAAILKTQIENMNPTMWVTIKKRPGLEYASGTKHAKRGDALVGERGRELVETKGGYMLVDEPTILPLDEGDRVHKNADTEKILRRSKNAVANISPAFASGSPGSGPSIKPPSSVTSPKAGKKSSTSWKKYFEQLFDWIEVRLSRLSDVTDKWTRQIKAAIGYVAKNKAIDKTIASYSDQIKALQEASVKYQQQADAVAKKSGLKATTINKIKNGTMDISLYSGDQKARIQEYMDWYNKSQDALKKVEELKDAQEELNHQKLDNIVSHYENLIGVIDTASEKAQANLDLKVSQGKEIKESDYTPLISNEKNRIKTLTDKRAAMQAEFNKQVAAGTLKQGSDAMYEYQRQLAEVDLALIDANSQLIEFQDAVKNIPLTNLGYLLSDLEAIQQRLQSTLDLAEAQGRTATASMYKDMIANGTKQIANLEKQNALLREQQLGLDPLSEKYREIQDQIVDNQDAISGMKVSQEQWNDAILDLRIGELQKLKDELSKTNDAYKRQMDLQQAIEDLEKAKSQRNRRILKDGKFVFEQNQEDVADKQRALDEAMHNETLAKIDDAIDAIEAMKPEYNVYSPVGASEISFSDMYPNASIDGLINGILGAANAGVDFTEYAKANPIASVVNSNDKTSNVTVSPNAIQINVPSGSAYDVIKVLQTELSEVFTTRAYE